MKDSLGERIYRESNLPSSGSLLHMARPRSGQNQKPAASSHMDAGAQELRASAVALPVVFAGSWIRNGPLGLEL